MAAAARRGDYGQAEDLRGEAYLVFEEGLEHPLANRDPELKEEIEHLFWEGSESQPGLAALIASEAPADQIDAQAGHVREELEEAHDLLGVTMTGPLAMLNSAAIILREGLEAVLIIGAVLGYLRATRRDARTQRWVYAGVLIGIALSVATWWASSRLIRITTANRELLEGVTSLLAVAVLFYVTNWLFHRVYVVGWMSFIKDEVGRSLRAGSLAGLAFLSFTVVYREGFETVLFYQALLFDARPAMVLAGFGVGAAAIVGIAVVILRLSGRVPIKPLFTATGIVLLILAVRFSGVGIHELQEAGVVGITPLPALPTGGVVADMLGLFPTAETLAAQAVLLAGVAATFALSRWQWARRAAREAQAEG
jgi:high-affinity iron transporter